MAPTSEPDEQTDDGRSSSDHRETARYVRSERLASVEHDDYVVVLGLDPAGAASPIVLSGSSQKIWDVLATERSVSDIVTSVASLYGVDPDVIEADCANFVQQLAAERMIREL